MIDETNVSYSKPESTNLSREAIGAFAEDVAKRVGFVPGAELLPIVEKIGGKVVYQELGELVLSSSGSISVEGKRDFTIFLAQHTSADRDRFTIAHELGHYVLHFLLAIHGGRDIQRLQAARYGDDRTEFEANWFAAAFLMPALEFKEAYLESGADISSVATRFKVSRSAAEVRARTLGLRQ